jgi:hypothetical protein
VSEESVAREGLDVRRYPFKWKKAQELAHSPDLSEKHLVLPYWERVRLIFLELGGEYESATPAHERRK